VQEISLSPPDDSIDESSCLPASFWGLFNKLSCFGALSIILGFGPYVIERISSGFTIGDCVGVEGEVGLNWVT
jgi:hypothetical protein